MATWQDFLKEARRFWEVAQAVNAPGYHSQAVSNAVHAVIAANDALCLFQIGERAQSDSHAEAANMLKRACRGTAFEQQVTQRARQLTCFSRKRHRSTMGSRWTARPPDV